MKHWLYFLGGVLGIFLLRSYQRGDAAFAAAEADAHVRRLASEEWSQ